MSRLLIEPKLFGIIALSSLGSVPLHVSTIWVESLSIGEGFGFTASNAALSAYFLGQIIAAAIPAVSPVRLTAQGVMGLAVVLVGLLAVSSFATSPLGLVAVWFVVGVCCGGLIYAGFRAASESANIKRAFAARLSISLLLSGLVAFLIYLSDRSSFANAMYLMTSVMAAVLLLSARNVYRSRWSDRIDAGPGGYVRVRWRGLIAILTVLVLFAGQIGFLANAGLYVSASTALGGATSLATGVAKTVVGMLLVFVFLVQDNWSNRTVAGVGLGLMASVLAMYFGNFLLVVVLGFVLFELTFNVLSSVLFGDVSSRTTGLMQRLILFSALGGGFAGPALAGVFLDAGLTYMPAMMALSSVVYVLLWRKIAVGDRRHGG